MKKREFSQEMLLMGGCPNCGQEVNRQFVEKTIDEIVDLAVSKEREKKIDENTSDGYHTFKELYEFRLLYNAALFNELAKRENKKGDCNICGELTELYCKSCEDKEEDFRLWYCEKHYQSVVLTGNCCSGNEKIYNY